MDEKDLDQNGYVDVNQDLIKASSEQQHQKDVDAISQLLTNQFAADENASSDEPAKLEHVVLQEPDSTTNEIEEKRLKEEYDREIANLVSKIAEQQAEQPAPKATAETKPSVVADVVSTPTNGGCAYCAWCERLIELIYFHPKVDEILTWKDPKISGALVASILITLISFATFSLLSIVGFLLLAAMTLVGGYRLYLFVLAKIKGQSEDPINKYLNMKLSLPKDELQQVVKLIETHGNDYLNKLKQIVLWENPTTSAIAFLVTYVVYSIGCALNTITLLILLTIFAFTWPKVYSMYKVPIDQAVKKAHDQSVELIAKIKEKVPFLNKKKIQ